MNSIEIQCWLNNYAQWKCVILRQLHYISASRRVIQSIFVLFGSCVLIYVTKETLKFRLINFYLIDGYSRKRPETPRMLNFLSKTTWRRDATASLDKKFRYVHVLVARCSSIESCGHRVHVARRSAESLDTKLILSYYRNR